MDSVAKENFVNSFTCLCHKGNVPFLSSHKFKEEKIRQSMNFKPTQQELTGRDDINNISQSLGFW